MVRARHHQRRREGLTMDTSQTASGRAASVHVRDLSVAFGALPVLDKLNLDVRQGEFLVLLGPSGCGKSTLLNTIAGLQDASGGAVVIGERDVTDLEPKDRGIAMVFQSYALYPTMSVYDNLAFGLKVARLPRDEIDARVGRAAQMLELTPLLRRRPAALSGGQRQRVAIGRALVRDVGIFLFDEPLSNLDAQLRAELRVEIKRLHARLGTTMIYVTHDQIEALTLADRIAVMRNGVIQQLDAPETIYNNPRTLFVARFLGSPAMNFIAGRLAGGDGGAVFEADDIRLPLGAGHDGARFAPGRAVTLGVRPERIRLGDAARGAAFTWQAPVELREPLGGEALLWCFLGPSRLCVKTSAGFAARSGDTVPAGFDLADILLFDTQSGERL
jgi:multiple sugar transport system ATP-binding protein